MKSLSLTYAKSLFALCEEENKADAVMQELREISSVMNQNALLLDSPTVPLEERLSLIDTAFKGAEEYVINFIKILCEKKCVHLFTDCVKQYEKIYNKERNIEIVTVITATELSDTLRKRLTDKLEKESGKKIILDLKVDKSLLGGIVLRTENSQTDASVRARLEAMRKTLTI
ncbi:MAG: ATP synthase F1 subunit delta [Clostridia bacterium]|nr:ATP synthase F1 subunit delta [Clostridia bacterium]